MSGGHVNLGEHATATEKLELHPPPRVTFDFSVALMTVKNPRSPETDTDFATLAITTLAPDGTEITKYGPTSKSLGDLGKGKKINPGMSLKGIDVPDGGSVAFAFLVMNKGAWAALSTALETMDLIGSGVVGALSQGQIAATDAGSNDVAFPEVVAAIAGIAVILEAAKLIFADCDGVVVPGLMTIGRTELLSNAVAQPWEMTVDYPGTDSPDGCGANSDYTVKYRIEATPAPVPKVAMPSLIGLSPKNASRDVQAVGLHGVEETVVSNSAVIEPSIVVAQRPTAGILVPIGDTVHYTIKELSVPIPPRRAL
jgi:PASTA domain